MSGERSARKLGDLIGARGASHGRSGPSFGQGAYPNKPITIIVSYPAGGDTDALARLLAEKLSSRVGQSVLVDSA